jgi:hypothetical protein
MFHVYFSWTVRSNNSNSKKKIRGKVEDEGLRETWNAHIRRPENAASTQWSGNKEETAVQTVLIVFTLNVPNDYTAQDEFYCRHLDKFSNHRSSGRELLSVDGHHSHLHSSVLQVAETTNQAALPPSTLVVPYSHRTRVSSSPWLTVTNVQEILVSSKCPGRLRGPPSLIFSGYRGSFTGVIRPRHEADKPPPSTPAFMVWTKTSTLIFYLTNVISSAIILVFPRAFIKCR